MGNRFAGQGRSVILNPDKSLTLTLSKSDGLWYCGELNLTRNLGYGTYLFKVRTRLSDLDRNLVLGLFTYSDRDTRNYDEIDIEFSAWASPKNPVRGQYIVQPYEKPGHIAYFDLKGDEERNTYSFSWTKKSIEFLSWKGYGQRPEEGSPAILAAWVFDETKQLPSPSRAGVIINLYLSGKPAPEGSGLISVIIDAFEFVKAK